MHGRVATGYTFAMRSAVPRLLTGRPLAAAVLSIFVVLGPIAAWMRAALEAAPVFDCAVMKANPAASPGSRVGKYAWPRKALLPKAPAEVTPGVTAIKRVEDGQKLWTFIAAPPPAPGTRLDFCAEFTKPASLCLQSPGNPRQHRAPPAALL